jgi:hypothetical protein
MAWKIGARLRSGRSRVGATIASQFIDELERGPGLDVGAVRVGAADLAD